MRQHDSRRGPVRRGPGTVLAGFLFSAALLTGALAGCGAPAAELDRDAAAQLQSKVLAVTEAAAANDPATSLKLLDELATELDAAASRGAVSFNRHQSVRTSIEAVRVDLTSQQAAAAEAVRAAAEQEAAAKAAAKAAADAAAAAPPPVVIAPAPENPGKGGKAKGKD
ncbi:mucin-associated surface protein [Arthrobacter sp. UYCu712]|uniref:mucin-associated surface protein n=1 Tax=Arthrobacter sp. UYCu712 TaxID=3156340 RepID=UPI00339B4AA9